MSNVFFLKTETLRSKTLTRLLKSLDEGESEVLCVSPVDFHNWF